ncbi:MAG: hypothetical protein ACR2HP_10845 [Ilumatobacteraceae bacterium]
MLARKIWLDLGGVRRAEDTNVQRTTVAATSGTSIGRAASLPSRVGDLLSPRSTPGGFRLAAAVTTVVCALCGLIGAAAIAARDGSLDAAGTAARQLVDLQEVRTAAVEADSVAASSFLSRGGEQAVQRARYEEQLGAATSALAVVAQRAPTADIEALAAANTSLASFSGLIEQSRANNRQGFPVGAAYQRQASALVRSDLLPALDAVDLASRERLNSSLGDSTRNAAIAVVALLVALAVLVVASLLLFRRTRRVINVPIAVGGALVVAALAWSVFTLLPTGATVEETVDSDLSGADALARARAGAFDARSAESLTLINRGNGAANEADWLLADAEVLAALDAACDRGRGACLDDEWQAYRTEHENVRLLDDGGDYDDAVLLALSAAQSRFDEFTEPAEQAQRTRAEQVAAGFADARGPLGLLRWVVLVAGLGAAIAALVGFGQRLREYR